MGYDKGVYKLHLINSSKVGKLNLTNRTYKQILPTEMNTAT